MVLLFYAFVLSSTDWDVEAARSNWIWCFLDGRSIDRGPTAFGNIHKFVEQNRILTIYINVFFWKFLRKVNKQLLKLTILVKCFILCLERLPILLLEFDTLLCLQSAECRFSKGFISFVDKKVAITLILLRKVLLDESRRCVHHFYLLPAFVINKTDFVIFICYL